MASRQKETFSNEGTLIQGSGGAEKFCLKIKKIRRFYNEKEQMVE
jgi:hypothetical protein